ncbi:MAG TPA: VTT domain-containing protein [Actinomycetes bacterium]|nr:VTT domain-containing protein [Actinomycetes bacterium]
MDAVTALGPSLLDPNHLIATFGLIGILVILFAECGLLVGFFLPGDTLLFTAGVLVQRESLHESLWLVIALEAAAAIAGNLVGYEIGKRGGPAVFTRPDSRLFKPEYVDRTRHFFDRYGPSAIVLGRFVPIVRTVITVMAGAGRMTYRTYAVYTVIGGILWTAAITLLGYFLGNVDFIANNIELLVLLGVAVSVVPVLGQLFLSRRRSRRPQS